MKQNLQDEMFEVMLRSAFRDHHEEEELLTEEELKAQGAELHRFTPEFERKTEKLIKRMERKQWREKHRKGLRNLAAMLAVVFLTGGILITQVDALRVPVMSVIITISEKFSEISIGEQEQKRKVSERFDDYLPQYILPGFIIESVTEDRDSIKIHYTAEDGSGDFYSVSISRVSSNASYDTENAEISEILIQGYPAVLIEKVKNGEDFTQVVWFPADGQYHIAGFILGEDAIKILDSVEEYF